MQSKYHFHANREYQFTLQRKDISKYTKKKKKSLHLFNMAWDTMKINHIIPGQVG